MFILSYYLKICSRWNILEFIYLHYRIRESRGWCKWKFIWFHNKAAPSSMASNWKFDCLCRCKQLVYVLRISVNRRNVVFLDNIFSGCFLRNAFFRSSLRFYHITSRCLQPVTCLWCRGAEVDERFHSKQLCLCQQTDDLAFLSPSHFLLHSFKFYYYIGSK